MNFNQKLKSLGHNTYKDYLNGEHWKEFKIIYFASDHTKVCYVCKSVKVHLHHHTYDRLGYELLTDVVPLCKTHHDKVHEILYQASKRVEDTWWAVDVINGKSAALVIRNIKDRKKATRKKRTWKEKILQDKYVDLTKRRVDAVDYINGFRLRYKNHKEANKIDTKTCLLSKLEEQVEIFRNEEKKQKQSKTTKSVTHKVEPTIASSILKGPPPGFSLVSRALPVRKKDKNRKKFKGGS